MPAHSRNASITVAELSDNSGEIKSSKLLGDERSDVISTNSGQPLSISIVTGFSKNQSPLGKQKKATEHSIQNFEQSNSNIAGRNSIA